MPPRKKKTVPLLQTPATAQHASTKESHRPPILDLNDPNDPPQSPSVYEYLKNRTRRELKSLSIRIIDGLFGATWFWILFGIWACVNLMECLTGYRMFNDWKDPKPSRLQSLGVVLTFCVVLALGAWGFRKMRRIDGQGWRAFWDGKVGHHE